MTRFLNCGTRSLNLDNITHVEFVHRAKGNMAEVFFTSGESLTLKDDAADRLSAVLSELEACTEAETIPAGELPGYGLYDGDDEVLDGLQAAYLFNGSPDDAA